ncbi:MAG TPA: GntR family transcriptional regulator [Candidatus Acidoferrales bacterium]|nr:GntR family transcriptional regulator [Candidatus Acidoferrales bacterium]
MASPRTLRIDLASPRPVYDQIVSGLRAVLVAREFAPGDRLPTVRRLATDLGVHHNTVAESYRVLAEEGWLDLRRGRGAVVLGRREPRPTPRAKQGFGQRLEELVAKAITDGVPRSAIAGFMAALAKKIGKRRSGGK